MHWAPVADSTCRWGRPCQSAQHATVSGPHPNLGNDIQRSFECSTRAELERGFQPTVAPAAPSEPESAPAHAISISRSYAVCNPDLHLVAIQICILVILVFEIEAEQVRSLPAFKVRSLETLVGLQLGSATH